MNQYTSTESSVFVSAVSRTLPATESSLSVSFSEAAERNVNGQLPEEIRSLLANAEKSALARCNGRTGSAFDILSRSKDKSFKPSGPS